MFQQWHCLGSTQGHLLFVQKFVTLDNISFTPIRYTKKEKQASVSGLTVNKEQKKSKPLYQVSLLIKNKIILIFSMTPMK